MRGVREVSEITFPALRPGTRREVGGSPGADGGHCGETFASIARPPSLRMRFPAAPALPSGLRKSGWAAREPRDAADPGGWKALPGRKRRGHASGAAGARTELGVSGLSQTRPLAEPPPGPGPRRGCNSALERRGGEPRGPADDYQASRGSPLLRQLLAEALVVQW